MRLDMLTSDWHRLIKPVLPHASTDKDSPSLQAVRLELAPLALYAVATDRYTLAAERYQLYPVDRNSGDWPPVHIDKGEIAATLKIFTTGKDYDPELRVWVDRCAVPVSPSHTVDGWALTIERPEDGARMTLRDRRDPSVVDVLTEWRKPIAAALTRPKGRVLDGLDVPAWQLGRWKDAVHGGEQLRIWTGPERGDTILVAVEHHFAGVMVTQNYLPDPSRERSGLPWTAELLPSGVSADGEVTAAGE